MDIKLPEPMEELMARIESKAVTNFYGAPGTGKTNMCLIALRECAEKGGKAVFVDTEGGFSMERLKQICKDFEGVLKAIEIIEPKTFAEQSKAVYSLKEKDCGLVILDSAVALYRLEHGEEGSAEADGVRARDRKIVEANKELSRQMAFLSNLAREKDIPVIVTCHMYKKWETGIEDVVGGDPVKYWSKAVVFLEKTGRPSERKATVIKHRSIPEGKSVKFVIAEDGIRPSGFKIF